MEFLFPAKMGVSAMGVFEKILYFSIELRPKITKKDPENNINGEIAKTASRWNASFEVKVRYYGDKKSMCRF